MRPKKKEATGALHVIAFGARAAAVAIVVAVASVGYMVAFGARPVSESTVSRYLVTALGDEQTDSRATAPASAHTWLVEDAPRYAVIVAAALPALALVHVLRRFVHR
ncbi:MAG: hypothetical protein ACT4QD_05300 [Acidobacteriota bacterium]